MLDTQGAIYTRVNAVTAVTDLVANYVGGGKAIFSSAMPQDHELGPDPTILIDLPATSVENDTASDEYRETDSVIRIFSVPNGSNLKLLQAGEAVRSAMKSWPVEVIDGSTFQVLSVSGPEAAPTSDPSVDGLLLRVRQLIKET
jgi:hypothetical protein